MPADEVTHGTDVDESRVRTGPRHAAPKKPLFTRFHMPAGKAIATVAMPTAVLMGMGLTSSLALADNGSTTSPSSKSLTADEYKDCVAALADSTAGASATPTPTASASESADLSKDDATPSPSASDGSSSGKTSSSDSGSDDAATPTPSASATKPAESSGSSSGSTATATPSASAGSGDLLSSIGDAITGILTGGSSSSGSGSSTASATPTPTASASASATKDASSSVSDTVKDTTKKVTDTVGDAAKSVTDTASKAAGDTTKAVEKAAESATSSASPSASASTDTSDCPVSTDDTGGVDNPVNVPDDPWYLNASSLLLKGADYKGVVEVKTASGKVKKVLKYVISGGTDIGDLHQTVQDKQSGKTYHVQAASGSTSTIRDGDTVMYTESISGNLFGLIPITFDPDNPPPLNIPLIYFTNVKVVQAGQFGGTLTVPGLHNYITG